MQNIYEKLSETIKELNKIKQSVMQSRLKEIYSDIFEKFPWLTNFSWKQYTVFFNDGDECYFSTYFDDYCTVLNEEFGYEYNEEDLEKLNITDKEICSAKDYIYNHLKTFDTDDYKEIFGDHVQITVQRTGEVEIDSYTDHS